MANFCGMGENFMKNETAKWTSERRQIVAKLKDISMLKQCVQSHAHDFKSAYNGARITEWFI